MADYTQRLAEATKEELLQTIHAVIGANGTARSHVFSVMDYLDAQKTQQYSANRRTSRSSTRKGSQDSAIHLHPLLREVVEDMNRDIKICMTCSKAFEEKNNNEESCRRHTGHWLIEIEDSEHIQFVRASDAPKAIKDNKSLPWIMSCCCNTKQDLGEGCVRAKHIAVMAEDTGGDTSKN
ncbi:uncharacterized protein CTRU02_207194 [Colletotrichum truncatum]|uniref:Uncharacterized protein n=1 Tax=Colletotrichum truncatum TaxID=5467 RepID=A0ACC3Z041_COLTU|nr:uncharacterized protein CTRU02_01175 [Colletotrichum truncatum]KAF6800770.1 hypothetical protein CTRU02_01175 [Colletotrichum truncatum]